MVRTTTQPIDHRTVELDGVRYVILRETVFELLCEKAHLKQPGPSAESQSAKADLDLDQVSLAQKLVRRRRVAGLSQADLARRAGVRPETLNRIERGHTTPDFATMRKLVVAMNLAERELAAKTIQ